MNSTRKQHGEIMPSGTILLETFRRRRDLQIRLYRSTFETEPLYTLRMWERKETGWRKQKPFCGVIIREHEIARLITALQAGTQVDDEADPEATHE
jgi:hypothetical protein